MLRVRLDNSYGKILNQLSIEVLNKVDKACSFFVKGAQFSPAYQRGFWDGRKRLFSSSTYKFPVGLASTVVKILKEYYKVEIEDLRIKPKKIFNVPFSAKLRDYQEEIVVNAVKAQRGIIDSATGSGKTKIVLKIAQELGVKTLLVVNKKEALYDSIKEAKECFPGIEIGEYSGRKKKLGDFLTIVTVGAVAYCKKIKKGSKVIHTYPSLDFISAQGFQCILGDEIHRAGSDTYLLIMLKINAFYKYGATGTPFRTDGATLFLQAATGNIISSIKSYDLQKKGWLAKSKVFFVECNKPKELDSPISANEAYKFGIVHNNYRNSLIYKIVEKELGNSILILVERIDHGEELIKNIKKIDPNAEFIQGKTKNRKELKEKFESGELRTVVSTAIYTESANLPILEVVINGASKKSGIRVIQGIGRALRPMKEEARIYDFYDSFNFKMEAHSKERIKWVRKEKHEIIKLEEKDL